MIMEVASRRAHEEEQTDKATIQSRWAQWVNKAAENGAGSLHRWARQPETWKPTTAKDKQGNTTSHPAALLEQEVKKWEEAWRAEAAHPGHYRPDGPDLPALTPEVLIEAGKSFRQKSAETADGFHPRHVLQIPTQGLLGLCAFFAALEQQGT